jgi:hypothetical protein
MIKLSYTTDSVFWLYKSNLNTIEQIMKYNQGLMTKIGSTDSISSRNKNKINNIFCFPHNINIKKGDIIFVYNDTLKGKIKKGFYSHYIVSTNTELNKNYTDIFKDNDMQKYFVKYSSEYLYEESFNLNKLKDAFHNDTPIKSPILFNKKYTNEQIFKFIELPFDLGAFIFNIIIKKIKQKSIITPVSSKKNSKNDSDSDSADNSADNSADDSDDSNSDVSSDSADDSADSADVTSDSDVTSDDDSNQITSDSDLIFQTTKNSSGNMIPVLVILCDKISNKISINSKSKQKSELIEHYLNCGNCNTIDNNSINFKFSYILNKSNKKTKIEINIIKFDEVSDIYDSFNQMEHPYWEKEPKNPTYIINYIKDSGSEYNKCLLIKWWH